LRRKAIQVSFETPEYTANADALGTLRLLEAFYVVIYAIWLKHSMPRNIVISGSAA
jgi:GDP-D-mannose dehydratase